METTPTTEQGIRRAWDFLRSEITDKRALKELHKSVYGVVGLTDVADWFLWERLEASGLRWELVVENVTYLGAENRKVRSGNNSYDQTYYLVSAQGTLIIQGRPFPCVGAGENRRLDAAFKGAITSMFKNGCKWAGLTMSIYKGGAITDDYYDTGGDVSGSGVNQSRSASTGTSNTSPAVEPNPMATIVHATQVLDGKIVGVTPNSTSTPSPAASPGKKLTAEDFMASPINIARINILEEFNKALPKPHADAWVTAMTNLWLVKNEQDQLTDDMKKKETGGSPINYAFQLLVATHYSQCGRSCGHAQEFHAKLLNAGTEEVK